jgi:dimethylaniline monooxygenase (N-oxide forming)
MHSASYREPSRFAGQDVLVVGLGTSGCEIAGELAGTARSVRVAVRSPSWTMTRRLVGVPLDWIDNPVVARTVPWSARRPVLAALSRITTGRLYRHGRPRPTRRCGDDIIAISDSFPRAVRAGLVEFRAEVSGVDGRTVQFADNTTAEADVIVHATGFDLPTEFLPPELRPGASGLYRGISHPEADGLFFVGLVEAHRALLPIAEQQAIWTAAVLSGHLALPAASERGRVAKQDADRRLRDFGDRREFLVDYAKYLAALRRDRRARARE